MEIMNENLKKIGREVPSEDDLGLLMWKLESIEHILPYYKTMMKKEEK